MKIILPLLSLCFLSACQIYKSDFDCPHSPSLGCVSVSDVNERISRGDFDEALKSRKAAAINPRESIKTHTRTLDVTLYNGQKTQRRTLRVEDGL